MFRILTLSLCLLTTLAQAATINESSFSSEPRTNDDHTLIAPRFENAPTIDGDLGDTCWDSAATINAFWRTGSTETSEDQTLTWLGFDKDHLYVAWACRDKKLIGAPVDRDSSTVWKQDCVEVFLSPERDGATERQFILDVSGSVYDRRPGAEYGKGGKGWNPTWDGKVKVQPWGYTAEMRIAFAELTDVKTNPVVRGTTWTMKLTRHDYGDYTGARSSSWTMIGKNTGDAHAVGTLIFGDRNFIANGDGETLGNAGAPTGWAVSAVGAVDITLAADTTEKTEGNQSIAVAVQGKKTTGAFGRVSLGIDTLPAAPVETTYLFTADVQAVCPEETLVAYLVSFQGGETEQLNFKHNAGWQKVRALVTTPAGERTKAPLLQTAAVSGASKLTEGRGIIRLDNVRLEIVDARAIGLDPDSVCLTGNATDAYRTRNRRIAGTYTYTEPMTNDPWFPYYFAPGTGGPDQDFGLYRGDVPFDKGRLTDGHTATTVVWATMWAGHQGHDMTFDLKEDYVITRVVVKSSWKGQRMTHLYFKSPGEDIYTMVASDPDHVSFKTAGIHAEDLPRTDERVFGSINQTARWVRVQAEGRSPSQFSEIEIWGKPLSAVDTLPVRIAYRQSNGATPIANPQGTPEPSRDVPAVFPLPQEMNLQGAPVALADGVVIAYEPVESERAKITAEVLRDELKLCFDLAASVEPASSGKSATILIGEAANSPLTAAALKQLNQTVTAQSPGPEGYVFSAKDSKVVIAGSDARGAFYGVQSLLTLARKSKSGDWEIPGGLIRDWPDMPMRIIEGRAVPTEGLVRALARFRVNYYTPKYRFIHESIKHDAFAERYFVNFIPFLDFNTTVLREHPELTERPADEPLANVPMDARRNANPGHPKTWEVYFAAIDRWLPSFHGDILYIGMDETHHYSAGSRWNVSDESRAMNMSAGELLAYTINKIDKKAKEYGKRVFMHDTPFSRDWKLSYPGDPDPSWRKALPLLPKDLMFNVWHWNKKWVLEPLGKDYGFDLVYLCTGDRDWRPLENMDPNEDYPPTDFPGYFTGMNNYMAESSFTASKLLETQWVAWNAKAPRPKGEVANAAVARYAMLWNQLHLGEAMPPSVTATQDDFTPVDISAAATRSRIDQTPYDGRGWVDMGPNVDLRALKSGKTIMAGVPFNIIDESKNSGKSVVMVHNRMYTDRTLSDTAAVDTPNLKASSLVFLHSLDNAPGWNYLRRFELAGYYFIVFEDGTYDKMELKYGTSIGTWDGQRYEWEYAPAGDAMSYGRLAWTGQTMSGMDAKLYKTEWVNPKPNVAISKIILRSTHTPTLMNPMLLAVTAVSPSLAGQSSAQAMPSAQKLIPAQPVGTFYDLAGGTDESETRYVAPDGTVISTDRIANNLSDRTGNALLAADWRSYVGHVTIDGSQAARCETLNFAFIKPTRFTGVMVTGRFREQRKAANFAPMVYNFFIDVSTDGGKTWREVASVLEASPEEHGPVWLALPAESVQQVRVRQTQCEGTPDYHGFSRVKFYRRP